MICCLQETHFRHKDTHRLRVKGWKKIFQANGNKNNNKKAEVAILTSDKIENGLDTGRGKGKLGQSERVAWTTKRKIDS